MTMAFGEYLAVGVGAGLLAIATEGNLWTHGAGLFALDSLWLVLFQRDDVESPFFHAVSVALASMGILYLITLSSDGVGFWFAFMSAAFSAWLVHYAAGHLSITRDEYNAEKVFRATAGFTPITNEHRRLKRERRKRDHLPLVDIETPFGPSGFPPIRPTRSVPGGFRGTRWDRSWRSKLWDRFVGEGGLLFGDPRPDGTS